MEWAVSQMLSELTRQLAKNRPCRRPKESPKPISICTCKRPQEIPQFINGYCIHSDALMERFLH